jgi:hypothetical protein
VRAWLARWRRERALRRLLRDQEELERLADREAALWLRYVELEAQGEPSGYFDGVWHHFDRELVIQQWREAVQALSDARARFHAEHGAVSLAVARARVSVRSEMRVDD